MRKLFISLSILFGLGCNTQSTPANNDKGPEQRSEKTKLLIANMKLARDPHTYSLPNEARVTHLEWNAKVDFNKKIIAATATYDIQNLTGTDKIIFDTKQLHITSVMVDGVDQSFTLGDNKPFIGQPLIIPIEPRSKKVAITYTTSPDAEALLWVDGNQPFLFSQSQAILGRTWIPMQDSPGVRITYNAKVQVPANLLALMSAENPQAKNETGIYTFKMEQAIPGYLIALAVGNIEFRPIGDRTGVYAIPSVVRKAETEFSDMQKMVDAAEQLYGPYVWGRYDLLILPAAFPFGGMENPRLTFATPTIIAGDKSLVSLVAHELAHSWSGNLVTNSTWNDFWLNEGFTVYFEQRIMEAVYGRERSEMLAQIARQELDNTIADIQQSKFTEDSKLKLNLENRSPDDGMTDIAYNKGYFFLRLIEETVGREKFDPFVKNYFTSHAFQVMDTETFLDYLQKNLLDDSTAQKININAWVYGEGLPDNIPAIHSDKMKQVDELRKQWEAGKISTHQLPYQQWVYQEQYHFIFNLSNKVTTQKMAQLDDVFHISNTGNSEVLFAWLLQSIRKKYTSAYPQLEHFLMTVGRRKFVAPLFSEMVKTNQTRLAQSIYAKSKPTYHAVTIGTVDEILSQTNSTH